MISCRMASKASLALAAILAVGMGSADLCRAYTITTADGFGADARIRGGAFASNSYGGESFEAIHDPPPGANQLSNSRKTYLRFDLSGVSGVVLNVALELTSTNDFTIPPGGVTFDVYGLSDLDAGESWAENAITWNNAPQNDTNSPNGFLAGATLLGSTSFASIAEGETLSFSYASMASFLNADTNDLVTFMLVSQNVNTTNVYTFGSKENLDGYAFPTLQVTTDTVIPEPSTLTLALLGLAALVVLSQRKKLHLA